MSDLIELYKARIEALEKELKRKDEIIEAAVKLLSETKNEAEATIEAEIQAQ